MRSWTDLRACLCGRRAWPCRRVSQSGKEDVSRAELLQLISEAHVERGVNPTITAEEIDLVFTLFDTNKDGRLHYK
eukprot:SAG11_NODE_33012_length_279_cov_1.155556_1_plen_75_part_01